MYLYCFQFLQVHFGSFISGSIKYIKILFGINKLLLEGGSIINGVFLKANVIDELSIVVANITANKDDKSLFYDGDIEAFNLIDIKRKDDIIILNYKK